MVYIVQEFWEWRGGWRDRRTVPGVDRVVEIVRRIIRQPDFALIVLPDQRLRRYVDRQRWRLDHGGGSELRVAEHDDRAWPQGEAGLLGGGSMIDFVGHHEAARVRPLNRGVKS